MRIYLASKNIRKEELIKSSFMDDVVGLSFVVGVIGNIISVLLFLSPVETFIRIVSTKSTEAFDSNPYVYTLLTTSLWTYYGISKPGALLVASVNGFGAVVELVYLILYLKFAKTIEIRAKTAKHAVILDVGFLGAVILISKCMLDGETRISMIGTLGAILSIAMYGSPLAAVQMVIKTRSVEYMPFWLSFFTFLNGGIWTAYAVLVKDIFLLVPNAVGLFLGTIQLVVYVRYRILSNEQQYEEPLI